MKREPKTTDAHRERARRHYWTNRDEILDRMRRQRWARVKAGWRARAFVA
jgi:hypothetical protein